MDHLYTAAWMGLEREKGFFSCRGAFPANLATAEPAHLQHRQPLFAEILSSAPPPNRPPRMPRDDSQIFLQYHDLLLN
jgi:hypothetical protein